MIKAAAKLGASGPGRMAIPDLEDLGAAAPGSCRRYQPAKRSPSVRANTPLTLPTRRAAARGLTQHYRKAYTYLSHSHTLPSQTPDPT